MPLIEQLGLVEFGLELRRGLQWLAVGLDQIVHYQLKLRAIAP